jgi:hypothetical protein
VYFTAPPLTVSYSLNFTAPRVMVVMSGDNTTLQDVTTIVLTGYTYSFFLKLGYPFQSNDKFVAIRNNDSSLPLVQWVWINLIVMIMLVNISLTD